MSISEEVKRIGEVRKLLFTAEHKTNADHIRAMTDEELLGCLLELQDMAIKRFANFELPNYQWVADWLKQPYEEEGD